jgi:hypothetical protein
MIKRRPRLPGMQLVLWRVQFIIVDLAQLPLKHFFPRYHHYLAKPPAAQPLYTLSRPLFNQLNTLHFSCHSQHSLFSPWYAFLFNRLGESC